MIATSVADYIFSNEHINYLITYSFDFRNEELVSYYISFLRFVIAFFVCILFPVSYYESFFYSYFEFYIT